MSGLRFIFNDRKTDVTRKAMFAVKCDKATGELRVSFVERQFSGEDASEDIIDINKPLTAGVGTRVSLRITLEEDRVYFRVADKVITRELGFKPEKIELLGIGSSGIARFFERNLHS